MKTNSQLRRWPGFAGLLLLPFAPANAAQPAAPAGLTAYATEARNRAAVLLLGDALSPVVARRLRPRVATRLRPEIG